jgi:hypothetical protein
MRTKLLLGAAALAVSAAASMAQSNVYSLNIVGYANVPNPSGYTFQTAPFRVTTAVSNGANEILPANTGQYDGDTLLIWSGHSWANYGLDSTSPTGFSDASANPIPAPILSPGLGYLYQNNSGISNNLTYVGEVRTGTNVVSLPYPPEFRAVGSPAPLAGGIISSLQFSNNAGALDGDSIQIMVRTPTGLVKGFAINGFDSTSPTGFSDASANPIPEPQIPVGGGFFFDNANAVSTSWTQILNP